MKTGRRFSFGSLSVWMLLSFVLMTATVSAHPMGNFAICHYAKIGFSGNQPIRMRYILDLAEIPTVAEKKTIEATSGPVYLNDVKPRLLANLSLRVDGVAQTLKIHGERLVLSPGAGGLETLKITLDMQTDNVLPVGKPSRIEYHDGNYAERTGWKEIIVDAGGGILDTDPSDPPFSSADQSRELSVYPKDVIPPQQTEARFTVTPTGATNTVPNTVGQSGTPTSATTVSATPRDAFTESIRQQKLTPVIVFLSLLVAFAYGGMHALGPGHGKTMVAAYLVGTRGTPRHAILLGIIVTITHTLGVFALGFVTLFAERYIVPERLYPYLSAFSGLSVAGVGGWLLYTRLVALKRHNAHLHAHEHTHSHDHEHIHTHDDLDEHGGHDHGFGYHSHSMPEGPVTPKTLIALGVSGGIVPCPSALIVLLAAIALNRVVYGMVLVTAFSLGLATVLIVIGLAVVLAHHWMDRLPRRNLENARLQTVGRFLPIASAAAIVAVGAVLFVRSFTGGQ